MPCQFENFGFCAKLNEKHRKLLCESGCEFRKYVRGQGMEYRFWENSFCILQDGLMAFGDFEESGKFVTLEAAGGGTLLSPGKIVDIWSSPSANTEVLCLQNCTVAFPKEEAVQALLQNDIDFVKHTYLELYLCAMESYQALKMVGGNSSYDAVHYTLSWCRSNNIKKVTHELIAVLCNRSRPSVTLAMHEIAKKDPSLLEGF